MYCHIKIHEYTDNVTGKFPKCIESKIYTHYKLRKPVLKTREQNPLARKPLENRVLSDFMGDFIFK